MTHDKKLSVADEAAWQEYRKTQEHQRLGFTENDNRKAGFIAGRASLRDAINNRLDMMNHPYGDPRINQWSERESIRELYGDSFITDLEDLLGSGEAELTVSTVKDGWTELDRRKPEDWLPGDRFTIKELPEPTVARDDEYGNLVCGMYYVRRGQHWAVSCEVIHVERLVTPAE